MATGVFKGPTRRFFVKVGKHVDLKGPPNPNLEREEDETDKSWEKRKNQPTERHFRAGDEFESDDERLVQMPEKFELIVERPGHNVITIDETEKRPDETDEQFKARLKQLIERANSMLSGASPAGAPAPTPASGPSSDRLIPSLEQLGQLKVSELKALAKEEGVDVKACGDDKSKLVATLNAAR